jgi:hypothetical protein
MNMNCPDCGGAGTVLNPYAMGRSYMPCPTCCEDKKEDGPYLTKEEREKTQHIAYLKSIGY